MIKSSAMTFTFICSRFLSESLVFSVWNLQSARNKIANWWGWIMILEMTHQMTSVKVEPMLMFPRETQIMNEKNQTNVTNATMPPLLHAIWGGIWKRTVEKNQTSATSATLHQSKLTIWGSIWKRTVEKNQTSATSATLHQSKLTFEEAFENALWRKIKQMRPVQHYFNPSWQFEEAFENAQWGKI